MLRSVGVVRFSCAGAKGRVNLVAPGSLFTKLRQRHDRAKHSAAPDGNFSRARLCLKNEESSAGSGKFRSSFDHHSGRHGLEVVHFDARSHADGAGRQMRRNGLRGRDFHQANHRRRGEDGRQSRIVRRDGPFKRDFARDGAFEAQRQQRIPGFALCASGPFSRGTSGWLLSRLPHGLLSCDGMGA
jgi:hypothetical protein